ncbi:haloacetate dehalogenase [Paraburkholderia sp. WC7.3g]|uniref:Alpha/beta hydrolase n=1 Tax=Paraburkholderia podalyriae TaxID=1938811 RepID=A0ABR7PJ28_9BURK|nr:alpha/beta hydrolase [Paraburkholderia podalyriae]MBC8746347.1 alpha/beta hydrolase [Paraburkholderia podalyriae]
MFDGFEAVTVDTGESKIFLRTSGSGVPLLLLHGFPETHLMWREVASLLAKQYTIVCPDLRGYGNSGCPNSSFNHEPYSKRALARDMINVMRQIGHDHFSVAGHDRGARVGHRMALDFPDQILHFAAFDILPTEVMWDNADARFALSFWPWSLLSQPSPLPERLISAAPEAVVNDALDCWGTKGETFSQEVREAYVDALRDPVRVHAICEEYRAAATIDREHDRSDIASGKKIMCPLLVVWSKHGGIESWYQEHGGPLELWRKFAHTVQGHAIDGGHFFPEELPTETASILHEFISKSA